MLLSILKRLSSVSRLAIKLSFFTVVAFFIARYTYINWETIKGQVWQVDWMFFSLSLFFGWLAFLAIVELWRQTLMICGLNFSYRKAWNIWYMTLLAKYVPGKVWVTLTLIYSTARTGSSLAKSTAAAALFICMSFVGLAEAFLITLPWWGILPSDYFIVFAILVLVIAGLLIHPKIFRVLFRFILERIDRSVVDIEMRHSQLFKLALMSAFVCLIQGVSFAVFARTLASFGWNTLPLLIGAFNISILFGIVSFFAPAGLGVREGVLLAILSGAFAPGAAFMVSIGARLWFTIAEMTFAGFSWLATVHLFPRKFMHANEK